MTIDKFDSMLRHVLDEVVYHHHQDFGEWLVQQDIRCKYDAVNYAHNCDVDDWWERYTDHLSLDVNDLDRDDRFIIEDWLFEHTQGHLASDAAILLKFIGEKK